MILYEHLQIPQDSTQEQIEKSYRNLAYIHTRRNDRAGMVDLNRSYGILRDPYKRSFYDRYGDKYLQSLQSPADSFFITRLFVPWNVCCLLAYAYLNTVNFFFLGLICKAFEQAVLRYVLFISSPILLAIVSASTSRHMHLGDRNMLRLGLCTAIAILNSVSIAVLALGLGAQWLAATEVVANACLFACTKYDEGISSCFQKFLLIKAVLMLLYYLGPAQPHYFIPCLVCLGACVFGATIGIALAIMVLPMCLSIFLDEATSYVVLPSVIHALHGVLGCIILFNLSSITYKLLVQTSNKTHLCRLTISETTNTRSCIQMP